MSNTFKPFSLSFSLLLITNVFCYSLVNAQQKSDSKFLLDSISRLASTINFGENDIVKYNANELLIETLYTILTSKDDQKLKFDSVKNLSYLEPTDKAFKLFTWTIKKDDETFENFGVLQTINPKTKRVVVYTLKDKSEVVFNPENSIGDAENWYGAVYYKVLTTTINKKKYYTLLG